MHSVLSEDSIFDVISGIASTIKGSEKEYKSKKDMYMKGSVTRYTKDLVMTFPVLADTTIDLNTLQLINKANERNMVTLMQLVFASMSVSGKNGRDAVMAIHKNIDGLGMDEIIDILNSTNESTDTPELRAAQREALREMTDQLRSGAVYKTFRSDSINEESLNRFLVRENGGNISLMEVTNNLVDKHLDKAYGINEEDDGISKAQDSDYTFSMPKVTNNDIKKVNELQPTLLTVNVNTPLGGKGELVKTTILVGIKSRCIGVEQTDIVERIVSKKKSEISLKNFIRATTGEIRFTKDFIANIKQAKINAKNAVKKGPAAKMWDVLEKRAIARNANKAARFGNEGNAIASLAIEMNTVNILKSRYNIDLEDPKAAALLMDAYCLLGLFIVDTANEAVKVMYDGNTNFELVSFSSLSKENTDKEYKKLINMINNMGR